MTVSQSASWSFHSTLSRSTPALFTTMSRRPVSATVRRTASSTDSLLLTSQASAAAPSSRAARSTSSASKSSKNTAAPAVCRCRASSRPIPRAAPVTIAVRPVKSKLRFGMEGFLSQAYSQAEVPADEFFHDFVGAGPDLGDPGVLPRTSDAVLVHVAVAAVQLHAVIEDVVLRLGGPPLRLRCVDPVEDPTGM